jgi:hypothetical protein
MAREPRTSGPVAPEIVIQCDLDGMTIAFTELLTGADEAKVNDRLDLYTRVVGRQRAIIGLTNKLVDLLALQKTVATYDERRIEYARNRAGEKIRMRAEMEANHQMSRKRVSDFEPSMQQQQQLKNFDLSTEAGLHKMEADQQQYLRDIDMAEAQVERLRARIAGGDPLEPLEEESDKLRERLPDAAD